MKAWNARINAEFWVHFSAIRLIFKYFPENVEKLMARLKNFWGDFMLKFIFLFLSLPLSFVCRKQEKREISNGKERAQQTRSGIDFRLKIPLVCFLLLCVCVCIFVQHTFQMCYSWIVGSIFVLFHFRIIYFINVPSVSYHTLSYLISPIYANRKYYRFQQ